MSVAKTADPLIQSAARSLAQGDPLRTLKQLGLRQDPSALALRGIALAHLGDLSRARALLIRAATAFGSAHAVARARCEIAAAEVALALRDLTSVPCALEAAQRTLEQAGDRLNAAHARLVQARHLALLGQIQAATALVESIEPAGLSPALRAVRSLLRSGLAMRRLDAGAARHALAQAHEAAREAGLGALQREIDTADALLQAPAARRLAPAPAGPLRLDQIQDLLSSHACVVDGCRGWFRHPGGQIDLAQRPVLFLLLQVLAQAWPRAVTRHELGRRVFRARDMDESQRVRLRVEIGRLRARLRGIARITATGHGFVLHLERSPCVLVLAPPVDVPHPDVHALLSDGQPWPSSAIAQVLGLSQRSAQRALESLAAVGAARASGRGRARRWHAPPLPGFATCLLLPPAPSAD